MEKIKIESCHSNQSSDTESAENEDKAIFDFLFEVQPNKGGKQSPTLLHLLNPFHKEELSVNENNSNAKIAKINGKSKKF